MMTVEQVIEVLKAIEEYCFDEKIEADDAGETQEADMLEDVESGARTVYEYLEDRGLPEVPDAK